MTMYSEYNKPVKVRYYFNQTIEKSVGFTLHDNENTIDGMLWFEKIRKEHLKISFHYFERKFESYKKNHRDAGWEDYEKYVLTHFWLDISGYRIGMNNETILRKKEDLIRNLKNYFALNFPNVELIKGDEDITFSSRPTSKLGAWW